MSNDTFSSFNNEEVVKLIKKMALTKAYGVRQFVEAQPDKIMGLCQDNRMVGARGRG